MDAKQAQSLKTHSDQLANFIVRLSSFYDGLSADIDKELQLLRGHLSGKPNYSLSAVSINKLDKLFMQQEFNVKKFTNQLIKQLDRELKTFQKFSLTPKEINLQSTKIAMELKQPVRSLFDVIDLHERVLQLYTKSFKHIENEQAREFIEEAKIDGGSSSLDETDICHKIRENLVQELAELVNSYARVNPHDAHIQSLQERISGGLSENELLNSCLMMLRVLVQETLAEANTAGKVIQKLDNALNQMQANVEEGKATSETIFHARVSRNQDLKNVMGDMEEAVTHAHSIELLKEQTQSYLEKMTASVAKSEDADKIEQEGLMTLLASMQTQLTFLQNQTQAYRKQIIAQRVSMFTDPLTKIANRLAYNDRSRKEWRRAQEQNIPLNIALIDVDHFKQINDKFGHAAGDKTLQVIARHIRLHLNKHEFVARWGGEEFILLIPNLTHTGLTEHLEKLRRSLASLPFKFKKEPVSITISMGATRCILGEELTQAFERADKNLYKAKETGRNRIVIK
jgi:diguanylate cyclase (GGDEF)-like protein